MTLTRGSRSQLTLVGVNPALDQFAETAALMKKTAEQAADEAGKSLADRLSA